MAKADPDAKRIAAQNRRARFDYFIDDTLEAGIILTGTEVKSLRNGRASINEAYAGERDGVLQLINAYIPEYQLAARAFQHETKRPRQLLVRKREMGKLLMSIKREGVTIVPMSIYFNDRGIAKVQLGIARGKKKGDKREAEKERDWKRDQARMMQHKG